MNYATDPDADELFPDPPNQYGVVLMDEWKPPSSEDFINLIVEYEHDDFELPPSKSGYTYFVHTADGETFTREEWE